MYTHLPSNFHLRIAAKSPQKGVGDKGQVHDFSLCAVWRWGDLLVTNNGKKPKAGESQILARTCSPVTPSMCYWKISAESEERHLRKLPEGSTRVNTDC